MTRNDLEVAAVLRRHWDWINTDLSLNPWQVRTLKALRNCRTAEMGGHIDRCGSCGHLQISYNSCRNRHCPKCQGNKREAWVRAREAELLPVRYFHVVFTLPDVLNPLCMAHPREMYDLLFQSAWSVIKSFSSDPSHLGAASGMFAVLHTWGQNLSLHPHLHCVVPAGGLLSNGRWKHARSQGKFLFPVEAMSPVFRARFVQGLRQIAREQQWKIKRDVFERLFSKPWVVFANQPFAGPEQVISYLGRYTHRVAISNNRIKSISDEGVSFLWKDYRKGERKLLMSLEPREFIRRFALHILPRGFVRIRHYGILASSVKKKMLERARKDLKVEIRTRALEATATGNGKILPPCPCCGKATMERLLEFDHRGPPAGLVSALEQAQNRTKTCTTTN